MTVPEMIGLPFHPWWHKPHRPGMHRGTYQFTDHTKPIYLGTWAWTPDHGSIFTPAPATEARHNNPRRTP